MNLRELAFARERSKLLETAGHQGPGHHDQIKTQIKSLFESIKNTPPKEPFFPEGEEEPHVRKAELATFVRSLIPICAMPHSHERTTEFANTCHSKSDGRFCKGSRSGKAAPTKLLTDVSTAVVKRTATIAAERAAFVKKARARGQVIRDRMAQIRSEMDALASAPANADTVIKTIALHNEFRALCLEHVSLSKRVKKTGDHGSCPQSAEDTLKGILTTAPTPNGIDHSKVYVGDYEVPGEDGRTCDLMQSAIRREIEQIREAETGRFQNPTKAATARAELDRLKEKNLKYCAGESGSWSK